MLGLTQTECRRFEPVHPLAFKPGRKPDFRRTPDRVRTATCSSCIGAGFRSEMLGRSSSPPGPATAGAGELSDDELNNAAGDLSFDTCTGAEGEDEDIQDAWALLMQTYAVG